MLIMKFKGVGGRKINTAEPTCLLIQEKNNIPLDFKRLLEKISLCVPKSNIYKLRVF